MGRDRRLVGVSFQSHFEVGVKAVMEKSGVGELDGVGVGRLAGAGVGAPGGSCGWGSK